MTPKTKSEQSEHSIIQPTWPAPKHIQAYTTTRSAWGDPTTPPKSPESTAALKKLLHLPGNPAWIHQTHSTIAIPADAAHCTDTADASFTNNINQVCVVLTADCLPLLICNKQGTEVAAIHAGWRGLANHIIETTLTAMNQAPEDLLVWLGPAIGPHKFEVGQDVYDAFVAKEPAASDAFTPTTTHKWLANLYLLATLRLQQQGIRHIYGGDLCTHTQSDLFYSYRRDNGKTGRMASVIWISG